MDQIKRLCSNVQTHTMVKLPAQKGIGEGGGKIANSKQSLDVQTQSRVSLKQATCRMQCCRGNTGVHTCRYTSCRHTRLACKHRLTFKGSILCMHGRVYDLLLRSEAAKNPFWFDSFKQSPKSAYACGCNCSGRKPIVLKIWYMSARDDLAVFLLPFVLATSTYRHFFGFLVPLPL